MPYKKASPFYRFSFLIVISFALLIIDHRSNMMNSIKAASTVINIPFEFLARLPEQVVSQVRQYYPDSSLHDELRLLQQKQGMLEAKLQRYETLERENERLSKLLSASRRSSEEVLLSEIVEFGLEPFSKKIIINRGIESGVYLGQPAIAPEGVLGQVSQIGFRRSEITLITDPSHGLPVQVQRNGLRTIVQGSGNTDQITVPYLASQADVQRGDILVTSGMGGRFPVGYRVAVIKNIVKDANEAFLDITAETSAKIGFTKEVLLLWQNDDTNTDRAPYFRRIFGE